VSIGQAARSELSSRTAIVTGGGQGIGRAVALVLAERGADVLVCGRTSETLEAVATEIRRRGGVAVPVVADVARRDDVRKVVDTAVRELGGVDILVNCAQQTKPDVRVIDIDEETWDAVFGSGGLGTLYAMQAVQPIMKARGGGCIINFGSSTALTGDRGFGAYAMTKEAVRALSRVAAREWGRDNIRINVVCPAALTPGALAFRDAHPRAYEQMLKTVPLGRMGDELDDIVHAVVAMTTDDFRYLTGATLVLDGGRLLFP
jgi:2-hydroxycyclohexanecarboxyl-CoA dehydrogenase